MTREEAKELLPIIQAFADGKKVEFFNDVREWEDSEYLEFSRERKRYRIKPEPKYRPFKCQEECWNEMLKHQPFGYIKEKLSNNVVLITKISTNNLDNELYFYISNYTGHYKVGELFDYCTFVDGKPFGIKE